MLPSNCLVGVCLPGEGSQGQGGLGPQGLEGWAGIRGICHKGPPPPGQELLRSGMAGPWEDPECFLPAEPGFRVDLWSLGPRIVSLAQRLLVLCPWLSSLGLGSRPQPWFRSWLVFPSESRQCQPPLLPKPLHSVSPPRTHSLLRSSECRFSPDEDRLRGGSAAVCQPRILFWAPERPPSPNEWGACLLTPAEPPLRT